MFKNKLEPCFIFFIFTEFYACSLWFKIPWKILLWRLLHHSKCIFFSNCFKSYWISKLKF